MPYLDRQQNQRRSLRSKLENIKEAGKFLGFSVLSILLVLFILGWVAHAFQAQAASSGINKQLNYQGKLNTVAGIQVSNSSWSFRFRIYDSSTNGTLLWTERWTATTTQVTTVNGVFSVPLGSLGQADDLSDINWNSDSLYLQVDLDADTNGSFEESFSPRKRLTSSAYAFNADEIDGLHATSTAAVANYLLALDSFGNLNLFGQGVSSTYATTTWLYVRGDAQIDGNATTSGNLNISGYASTTNLVLADGASNLGTYYDLYVNSGNLFFNGSQLTGSSGLSFWQYAWDKTITPTSTDIGLYVTASSTIAADFRVDGSATTTGNFTVGTSTWVVLHDPYGTGNDKVGLGTANPDTPLDVWVPSNKGIQVTSLEPLGALSGGTLGMYTNQTPTAADQRLGRFLFGLVNPGSENYDTVFIGAFSEEVWDLPTARGTYMAIHTTASGGINRTEKMRITGAGKVGIGLTTPGQALDVIGNASTSLAIYAGTNLYVGQASNTDNDIIYFDAGGQNLTWDNANDYFSFSNDLYINGNATTTYLYASGSASTTLGLFTQGNLHVGSTASFDGLVSGAGFTLGQQNFWNSTSTWTAFDTNWARNANATTTYPGFASQFAAAWNATSTKNLNFTFSDNLKVNGNATTSGYLVVGTTNPVINHAAGDLFVGNTLSVGPDKSISNYGALITYTITGQPTTYGVYASSTNPSNTAYGVYGRGSGSTGNYGVAGEGRDGINAYGVFGTASGGSGSNYGIYGDVLVSGPNNYAGYFDDNVKIAGNATTTGTLHVGTASAADDDYLFMDGTSYEYLVWDDTGGADIGVTGEYGFELSDNLSVGGTASTSANLHLGVSSAADDDYLYMDGTSYEYLVWDDTGGADIGVTGEYGFELSDNLSVGGTASTSANLHLGVSSAADDDYLYMDGTSYEYLVWDDTGGADVGVTGEYGFELSDNLTVNGNATTTGYLTVGTWPTGGVGEAGNLNVQNSVTIGDTLYVATIRSTNNLAIKPDATGDVTFFATNEAAVKSVIIHGHASTSNNLYVGGGSAADDDYIFLDASDEYFEWNNQSGYGYWSAGLVIGGAATSTSFKITNVGGSASPAATQVLFSIATTSPGLNQNIKFKIRADGSYQADGALITGHADYAEYFWTKDEDLIAGETVCVDITKDNAVARCVRGADPNVMGIVSSNPAVIGNGPDDQERGNDYVIVGLLGQIPAFTSAENGPIRPGDSLTSASSIPGYLMKADSGDSTVGVALESLASGNSIIKVLISRRNKSLTVEQIEEKITKHIAEMEIEDEVNLLVANAVDNLNLDEEINGVVDPKFLLVESKLTVTTEALDNKISGTNYLVSDLQNTALEFDLRLNQTEEAIASFTEFAALTQATLLGLDTRIASLEDSNLTLAELVSNTQQGLANASSSISYLQQELSDIYAILNGQTNTTTPPLTVTQPDLEIQTLAVQQAATFYGTLYVQGEAGFMSKVVFDQDIEVKGKIYASADQAGTVIIPANATSTEVTFATEYEVAPKITATLASLVDVKYAITEKSKAGFRLSILEPIDQDATFDWIALAVKDEANPVVKGCLYPAALNYNSAANQDDGSCLPAEASAEAGQYPPVVVLGCTDQTAANYNPSATQDDGSCLPADVGAEAAAEAEPSTPIAEPTLPAEPIATSGCTDTAATNYNAMANQNDGSCLYPPEPPMAQDQVPVADQPVVQGDENGVGGPAL